MSTRSTIRSQVHKLLADHHQITASDLNTLLQAEDAEILESWGWSRRLTWTKVNTVAPASVAAIVTNGTSAILSASLTTAMDGRLIRIQSESDFYRLGSINQASYATLTDGDGNAINYAGTSGASVSADIFRHIYTVASNAERVLRISHNVPLREFDADFFVSLDPERITTADPPEAWAHYGRDSSDRLQVLLFPVPSAEMGLVVEYLKRADLDEDTDVPMYRPDLLKWKTAQSAACTLYSRSGDQVWLALIDKFGDLYEKALTAAKEDDMLKQSTPQTIQIPGALGLQSDEFRISHDVGGWGW